ncbi:hypothetical protein DS53801_19 [Lactococcus phage 53801]|nr:hypothetical protein DS53801_19 [Lactococcus phage 53801]
MSWRTRKMTKNDYIEKITQNLEHLTKDELKDVATLTNAQFGVRLKVAEKEYWGKEIANLKSQLQQQALPVVPDFIGKLINTFGAPEDGKYIDYSANYLENQKELEWIDNHQKTWLTALLIGFTVEKNIVSPCPICGYENVKSNFCSICGRKNDYE